MKLHISKGNMKLGGIPNISLSPQKSCKPGLPCYDKCYAMKSYRCYPTTKAAWDENLAIWMIDPGAFTVQLTSWLADNRPEYFRWHVGGDIPDELYLKLMISEAEVFPKTKFLAFTKRYDLVNGVPMPKNLQVILSRWPGLECPERPVGQRYAWLLDEGDPDPSIPEHAVRCPGSCKSCKHCFEGAYQGDVVFHKH